MAELTCSRCHGMLEYTYHIKALSNRKERAYG